MTSPSATSKIALFFLSLSMILTIVSCNKPPAAQEDSTSAKHFPMSGRVVSIDKPGKLVSIDGDAVPGFMDAMTMPYTIKDAAILDKLAVGDHIKGDIVVSNGESWLENVTVTGHSVPAPAKPTAALHIPTPGDPVPDFQFTNQNGKRISLKQYRGQAVLLTFIYTRCPFPDFCPRVSHQFSEINRELQRDPALYSKTHLLSISFDPAHDTPKVLRAYGFSCSGSQQPSLFHHWEFVAARAAQLPTLANYFALTYQPDAGLITHSLSTAVIGPDGRIFKWYHGADWQPSDLIKDAAAALHPAA